MSLMSGGDSLKSYHLAWLSVHPERTEEWLRRMMMDGFHVHHIDSNHANDEPKNLVLIEGGDHLMLHNGSTRLLWTPKRPPSSAKKAKKSTIRIRALKAEIETLKRAPQAEVKASAAQLITVSVAPNVGSGRQRLGETPIIDTSVRRGRRHLPSLESIRAAVYIE